MLDGKILDRARRLIESRFAERQKVLPKEVSRIMRKMQIHGASNSSVEIENVRTACEEEIRTKAKIVWDSIQEAHKALGSPVTETLRTDIKGEASRHIENAIKEASGLMAWRLSSMKPSVRLLDLESTKHEVIEKISVKVDLYVDTLEQESETAETEQVKMQLNESQGFPNEYLDKVSKQINEFIVDYSANKNKFCKHIEKVIREAEEYGKYLWTEWQKAKEAKSTQYDEDKDKGKWFWWTAYTNDWMTNDSVYFADDECLDVQFYIEGKPKQDPLGYLSSMIWGCVGQDYEGLELLDYQFVLLAIIHDAQNWQAGRKRIYFNPLEKGTLSDRLCQAVWHRLEGFQNSYEFKDIRETVDTALRAVIAELDAETKQKIKPVKDSKKTTSDWRSIPIPELITQGESHTVEFKETLQYNIQTKKLDSKVFNSSLKTIAAFLNADGGTLLIGVSDSSEIMGIERDKKAMGRANNDRFQLKIRDTISGQNSRFTPAVLGNVEISFKGLNKMVICRIDVQPLPASEIQHFDRKVYFRDGNRTIELTGPDLTNWITRRNK